MIMPSRSSVHPIASALTSQLEVKGYRTTGPRQQVVEAVARRRGHFSAEELCSELPHVGRATVYRTVRLLLEGGCLCRVLLENGSLHYRLSISGHHHHMVCAVCGSVQDLVGCDVTGALRALGQQAGFEVQGHWLEVYGRCPACRGTGE